MVLCATQPLTYGLEFDQMSCGPGYCCLWGPTCSVTRLGRIERGSGRLRLWKGPGSGSGCRGITSVQREACVGQVHGSLGWARRQHLSCVSGEEGCFL